MLNPKNNFSRGASIGPVPTHALHPAPYRRGKRQEQRLEGRLGERLEEGLRERLEERLGKRLEWRLGEKLMGAGWRRG